MTGMFTASTPFGFDDAARRASDIIATHLVADPQGARDRWVAIRLSDGGSDGVLYDDPRAAANAQLHWKTCMYVKVPWDGMSAREAQVMLGYWRACYDVGNTPPVLDGFIPVIPRTLEGVS